MKIRELWNDVLPLAAVLLMLALINGCGGADKGVRFSQSCPQGQHAEQSGCVADAK